MQTTISSKYQVVIPKAARERLNLQPQQKLTVIEKDGMLISYHRCRLRACAGLLDDILALKAADLALKHNLAMVDAMVYATALAYNAPLFTSDADFDGLPFVNRVG